MRARQAPTAGSGSHSEPGWLSLCISGPLLGAGTDCMLGRSLSIWGPTLGQVDMQVPYGSMHHPEGRGRRPWSQVRSSIPSYGLSHCVLSVRLNCPDLPMTVEQGWNSAVPRSVRC